MDIKPGTKLKSAVCDTEVMVIRGGDGDIQCGGAPMAEEKPATAGELDSAQAEGSLMGKRYVDDAGALELLCIKPGKGSLALNGTRLKIKQAKLLPSSD